MLLSGDRRDMRCLVALRDPVLSGKQESVALHDRISVPPNRPVTVFAVRSRPGKPTTGECFWWCSADLSLEIRDTIEPRRGAQAGHQYFDLVRGCFTNTRAYAESHHASRSGRFVVSCTNSRTAIQARAHTSRHCRQRARRCVPEKTCRSTKRIGHVD